MNTFDSILSKARKLAALADPESGASEGERANAISALAAHCERHGITPESLDASARRQRTIICKSRFKEQKPKPDKELARLCAQILRYVVGDTKRECQLNTVEIELPMRGAAIKLAKVYAISARVTDLEFQDWRECFEHYAPDFIDTMDELRAAVSRATAARKHGLSGFVHRHDIFAPSTEAAPGKRKAGAGLIAAMLAAKGAKWESREKLQGDNLLTA